MNASADKTKICNAALSIIGVSSYIDSIDDGSQQARVCKANWDLTVEQALQAYPWDFAMRYALLQTITKTVYGWAFVYAMPSDCLQARLIVPNITNTDITSTDFDIPGYSESYETFCEWYVRDNKIPFQVVENEAAGGLAICTNKESAVLAYTARVTTIPLWSAAFVNTVSLLLATKIVSPLAANPVFADRAAQGYRQSLIEAAALNFNEGREHQEPESEFITARN